MLEDEIILCPICNTELHVKVMRGKKITYIVPDNCPNCKTSTGKLERMLNKSSSVSTKTERSYIKTDPRG